MAIAFNIFIFGSSPNLVAADCSNCSNSWTTDISSTFSYGNCAFSIDFSYRDCDTTKELRVNSIQTLTSECDTTNKTTIYKYSLLYLLSQYYSIFSPIDTWDTNTVSIISNPCIKNADENGLIEFCDDTLCQNIKYNLTGSGKFVEIIGSNTFSKNYMGSPCGIVSPCGQELFEFFYTIPPGPLYTQLSSNPLDSNNCDDPCYWKLNGNDNVDDYYHFLGTINNQDLNFKTNNLQRMQISSEGKVGIQTKKPLGILDINFATWGGGHPSPELFGEASYPRLIFDVNGHDNINQNFIMATGVTSLCNAPNRVYEVFHWQINSNRANLHSLDPSVVTYSPLNLKVASPYCFDPLVGIDNDLLVTKFTFASDGYLGIMTSTPRDNLHVIGNMRINSSNTGNALEASAITGTHSDYLLAVEGKIVAKEIIVTASNWADYVFQPNYYLTPLAELELKIKELGHLPGIPSKAEVSTNGVSINVMQVKMLEKIEELTLYMIELQKENEKLKTKISQIEGVIK